MVLPEQLRNDVTELNLQIFMSRIYKFQRYFIEHISHDPRTAVSGFQSRESMTIEIVQVYLSLQIIAISVKDTRARR